MMPCGRALAKSDHFPYPTAIILPSIALLLMSRICQLSGKSAIFGNSRSHSNIASRRRQNVNLQVVRINGKRMRVAARTLRTIKKFVGTQHEEKA